MSFIACFLLLFYSSADAGPWEEIAATAEMTPAEVRALLANVPKRQSVLDRMARRYEAKPWYQYKPLFLSDKRVTDGVSFWRQHAETLGRVSQETGVPSEYIVSIIGIETSYGANMGRDPVLESLFTLGMYHPRRGSFFREELGHYLRLATDEGWTLSDRQGSYAGAMGMGQFMPSSYRKYAVDGDGDGKRDLFKNTDDAIASVANYFVTFGWQPNQPVMVEATMSATIAKTVAPSGLRPDHSVGELRKLGVSLPALPTESAAAVYAFALEDGEEYRVGLTNFYVITRYNHSSLYARAVHDLATRLRNAYR